MENTKQTSRLTVLFFFAWGFLFLERLSLVYMSEVFIQAMQLSTAAFSRLTAAHTLAFAISSMAGGWLADRFGQRKRMLALCLGLSGLFSLASAWAPTADVLLLCRVAVGLCSGPALTLMFALILESGGSAHFGRLSGLINAGLAIIATSIGPILVTRMVTVLPWQSVFVLTGTMLLIFSVLTARFAPERHAVLKTHATKEKQLSIWRVHNIRICLFIGICVQLGYWTVTIFAPLYLTQVMHFSTETRGLVTGLMGLFYIPLTIFLPAISDRIGRRSALMWGCLLAVVCPLTMALWPGLMLTVVIFCLCGNAAGALSGLFSGIIPMESLPDGQKTTAGGLLLGLSEIIGGFLWPMAAGAFADALGSVVAVMGFAAVMLLLAAVFALRLHETVRLNT